MGFPLNPSVIFSHQHHLRRDLRPRSRTAPTFARLDDCPSALVRNTAIQPTLNKKSRLRRCQLDTLMLQLFSFIFILLVLQILIEFPNAVSAQDVPRSPSIIIRQHTVDPAQSPFIQIEHSKISLATHQVIITGRIGQDPNSIERSWDRIATITIDLGDVNFLASSVHLHLVKVSTGDWLSYFMEPGPEVRHGGAARQQESSGSPTPSSRWLHNVYDAQWNPFQNYSPYEIIDFVFTVQLTQQTIIDFYQEKPPRLPKFVISLRLFQHSDGIFVQTPFEAGISDEWRGFDEWITNFRYDQTNIMAKTTPDLQLTPIHSFKYFTTTDTVELPTYQGPDGVCQVPLSMFNFHFYQPAFWLPERVEKNLDDLSSITLNITLRSQVSFYEWFDPIQNRLNNFENDDVRTKHPMYFASSFSITKDLYSQDELDLMNGNVPFCMINSHFPVKIDLGHNSPISSTIQSISMALPKSIFMEKLFPRSKALNFDEEPGLHSTSGSKNQSDSKLIAEDFPSPSLHSFSLSCYNVVIRVNFDLGLNRPNKSISLDTVNATLVYDTKYTFGIGGPNGHFFAPEDKSYASSSGEIKTFPAGSLQDGQLPPRNSKNSTVSSMSLVEKALLQSALPTSGEPKEFTYATTSRLSSAGFLALFSRRYSNEQVSAIMRYFNCITYEGDHQARVFFHCIYYRPVDVDHAQDSLLIRTSKIPVDDPPDFDSVKCRVVAYQLTQLPSSTNNLTPSRGRYYEELQSIPLTFYVNAPRSGITPLPNLEAIPRGFDPTQPMLLWGFVSAVGLNSNSNSNSGSNADVFTNTIRRVDFGVGHLSKDGQSHEAQSASFNGQWIAPMKRFTTSLPGMHTRRIVLPRVMAWNPSFITLSFDFDLSAHPSLPPLTNHTLPTDSKPYFELISLSFWNPSRLSRWGIWTSTVTPSEPFCQLTSSLSQALVPITLSELLFYRFNDPIFADYHNTTEVFYSQDPDRLFVFDVIRIKQTLRLDELRGFNELACKSLSTIFSSNITPTSAPLTLSADVVIPSQSPDDPGTQIRSELITLFFAGPTLSDDSAPPDPAPAPKPENETNWGFTAILVFICYLISIGLVGIILVSFCVKDVGKGAFKWIFKCIPSTLHSRKSFDSRAVLARAFMDDTHLKLKKMHKREETHNPTPTSLISRNQTQTFSQLLHNWDSLRKRREKRGDGNQDEFEFSLEEYYTNKHSAISSSFRSKQEQLRLKHHHQYQQKLNQLEPKKQTLYGLSQKKDS